MNNNFKPKGQFQQYVYDNLKAIRKMNEHQDKDRKDLRKLVEKNSNTLSSHKDMIRKNEKDISNIALKVSGIAAFITIAISLLKYLII